MGSFYALFGGKEECFLATYDAVVEEGKRELAKAIPPAAPWGEQMVAMLRALLALIEEDPFAARIALVEVQAAGLEALDHHERNLEAAAELLRGGRESSPFSAELPETLEFATVGGLTWFLQQRIAAGEISTATALLPEVLEVVVEPYLGEEATARLIAEPRSTPSGGYARG